MNNTKGSIHFEITADDTDFKRKLAQTRQGIIDSAKTAEREASKIEGMFKRTSLVTAGFFSADMIKNFGMQLIDITGKFQTFEAVLTNTLQSSQKAKQAMSMLQNFAATTPFQVDALTGAFIKLANQGFVPTYEQMSKLGDLASSTGKGFDQLAEVMIDAQTGEFERLKEFGIMASKEGDKVVFTFKEQQTQVAFTASSIRDYILSLGDMQGVAGANAKIAETLTGKYFNLQDAITQMMNEIGQSSEGALSGTLSGAGYLVEHYEEVGELLAGLIVAYGTYTTAVVASAAVSKAVEATRLTQEATELQKLLTVEQQAKISKLNLSKTSVEYAAAVKAEIGSKMELLKATVTQITTERTSALAAHKDALQRALSSKILVAQKQQELVLAASSGSAADFERAKKALLLAQEERGIAVKARKTTADTLSIVSSKSKAASTSLETTTTLINTASQTANIASTIFLTIAKTKLSEITAKLNATMMANKYMLIATVVATVAYGIYKLVTAQTVAERAQERFNDKLEESKKKQDEFISKTNELIGVVRTETNTRYMQTKAFKELKEMYPEVLKNMTKEQILLMDNLEIQRLFNEGIDKKEQKDNVGSLEKAQKEYDKAKKSYKDFQSRAMTSWEVKNVGKQGEDNYINRIQAAKVELDNWKKIIKEQEQIIEETKSPEVKIVDLKQNIATLESELGEINKLLPTGRKPTEIELFKINSLNKEISEAQGQLKTLEMIQKESGKKNKAYWEKIREDAMENRDNLSPEEKDSKEWKNYTDEIAKADKMLEVYSNKIKEPPLKDNNTLKDQIEKEKQEKARLYKDMEFAVKQDEIDGNDEGLQKVLAQNRLNYDKEIEQIRRQKEDKLAKIQSWEYTIWENENKDWEKKGLTFKPKTTTLPQEDETNFGTFEKTAGVNFENDNKIAYENELKDYQTFANNYIDKVNEFNRNIEILASDLNAERQVLVDNGASKKELSDFDAQAQATIEGVKSVNSEILAGMTSEMNTRSDTFVTFLDEIATAGIDTLIQKITETEQLLETAKSSEDSNSVDVIKKYEQQIKILKEQVAKGGNKNSKTEKKEDKNDLKKQKAILAATEALGTAANDVAVAFKGLDGDIFDVMGSIGNMASSVGSVLSAIVAMHTASTMTISTTSVLANGTILVTSQVAAEGIKAVEKASVILAIIGAALQIVTTIANVLASAFSKDKKKEKEINSLQTQVDALKESYEELEKVIDKSYSSKASNLIEEEIQNLENQKKLIEEQKRLEESKKKSDKGKIGEYDKSLDDIDKKLEENKEKAVDVIFGEDLKSAIDNFASAYADAWTTGEDRAAAQKDVVKKMIQNVVSEIVKSNISDKVKELRESIKAAIDNDGVIDAYEQKQIDKITDGIYAQSEKDSQWADKYMNDDSNTKQQSATSGGFETMSQETASELNGTFLSMRNTMGISKDILVQMNETATRMIARMDAGQETIIDMKGLVVIAVGHLDAISKNTFKLHEMNDKLGKIEINTSRL